MISHKKFRFAFLQRLWQPLNPLLVKWPLHLPSDHHFIRMLVLYHKQVVIVPSPKVLHWDILFIHLKYRSTLCCSVQFHSKGSNSETNNEWEQRYTSNQYSTTQRSQYRTIDVDRFSLVMPAKEPIRRFHGLFPLSLVRWVRFNEMRLFDYCGTWTWRVVQSTKNES